MQEYYLVAQDNKAVRLYIGEHASWEAAVTYVNACRGNTTWTRNYRVSTCPGVPSIFSAECR